MDRLAEQIVMETWRAPDAAPTAIDALDRVIATVRKNFASPIDFDALAARQGMSRTTFRRRWAERVAVPPARHLQELRMRDARQAGDPTLILRMDNLALDLL